MNKRKIYILAGTRPNFVKIAPLQREFTRHSGEFDVKVIHTGQHYDYLMSKVFFEQLELPEPDFYLEVGSGSHGYQTAQVLMRFESLAMENCPDLVVVVGDVNSTVAASLAAIKLGIPVAHVEAGLRSFDMEMPEEINRILTDRISKLLFATEQSAIENLANEGMDMQRVHLVGNVMIDSLSYNLDRIRENSTAERMGLPGKKYGLVTLHRPSNVDTADSLRSVAAILRKAALRGKLIFPAHPRTTKNIDAFKLRNEFESIDGLELIEPLGYLDFMNLMVNSSFILTDSGGIQEETTWLGIPCVTLRKNTERPITLIEGTNCITGLDISKVSNALDLADGFNISTYSPPLLWDGKSAGRIVDIIDDYL